MAKKVLAKVSEEKPAVSKTAATTIKPAPAAQLATAKAEPLAKKAAPTTAPTREQIAKRAFEIYMGRGQTAGRETEDWAQAERELRAEAQRNN
jgi:hypothetical protein